MVVTLSGTVTRSSFAQDENAESPMEVTVSGMVISVKAHPLKA